MLVGSSSQILVMAQKNVFAIIGSYIWHLKIKFGIIPGVMWEDDVY